MTLAYLDSGGGSLLGSAVVLLSMVITVGAIVGIVYLVTNRSGHRP